MRTYVAFIRAIFHIKMERLRRPVEAAGYENVDTYLASGNIIFSADAPVTGSSEVDSPNAGGAEEDATTILERDVERALGDELGKEMDAFIRPIGHLREIAAYRPFEDYDNHTVYIAFLKDAPGEEAAEKLAAHATEINEFHIDGREVYWLCRTKQRESSFSGSVLERTLGMPATLRNARTVRRIVKKYG